MRAKIMARSEARVRSASVTRLADEEGLLLSSDSTKVKERSSFSQSCCSGPCCGDLPRVEEEELDTVVDDLSSANEIHWSIWAGLGVGAEVLGVVGEAGNCCADGAKRDQRDSQLELFAKHVRACFAACCLQSSPCCCGSARGTKNQRHYAERSILDMV